MREAVTSRCGCYGLFVSSPGLHELWSRRGYVCAFCRPIGQTTRKSGCGRWQYDPVRRVISGDARAKEILDFPGRELVIDALMERVHPDDSERVSAAFVGSLNPANTKRPATEFRLRHRDGKFRWLETRGLSISREPGLNGGP